SAKKKKKKKLDAEDAAKKKKKKASGKKGKGAQQAEHKTGLRPLAVMSYAEADDELTPHNSKGWENEASESDEDEAERLLGEKPEADSDSDGRPTSIADSDSDSTDAASATCSERAVRNQTIAKQKIETVRKSIKRANAHLTNLAGQEAQFEGSETKKMNFQMPVRPANDITEVTLIEVRWHQARQLEHMITLQEEMEVRRERKKLEDETLRTIKRTIVEVKQAVNAPDEVLKKKMESAMLQISHNRVRITDLAVTDLTVKVGHNRLLIKDLAVKVGHNTEALAQLSRGQDPPPAPSGASAPAPAPAPAPLVPAASRRRAGFGA
ncbi:hypothetical protein TeGR_g3047, partial [Tetraparma gracilis]